MNSLGSIKNEDQKLLTEIFSLSRPALVQYASLLIKVEDLKSQLEKERAELKREKAKSEDLRGRLKRKKAQNADCHIKIQELSYIIKRQEEGKSFSKRKKVTFKF